MSRWPAERALGTAGHCLTGPGLFAAGATVRDRIEVALSGCVHPVSPLSAGFLALTAERCDPSPTAAAALRLGRPVALVGAGARPAAERAADTSVRRITAAAASQSPPVEFLVPDRFVRGRRAAIRRRHAARPARPATGPRQLVTAVGVGRRSFGTEPLLWAALGSAGAVVATDWTFENTVPDLARWTGARRRAIAYDIHDYDLTIGNVNRALDELRAAGVERVALLIEGNPDTLDVLDGICPAERTVRVVPGVPVAVAVADAIGELMGPDPFRAGVAYLSGLPGRHNETPDQLDTELTCYLAAGVACVLVEMTFGDLDAALRAVRRSGRPKTLVMVTDCFTPAARVLVADTSADRYVRAVLNRAHGTLSTLVILDRVTGLASGDLLPLVR